MKKALLILSMAVLLLSCQEITINQPEAIKLKAGLNKKVTQDNDFAIDLLKHVASNTDDDNLFISPMSLSIALGMAWNGADGNTKKGIELALKMDGLNENDINEYYQIMQTKLPSIDPLTKLSLANSLWYREDFPIKPSFLNVNATNFNAYIKSLDFSTSWAKDMINNWCSKTTNGLIPTIIDENISNDMMLYLINAVYFKSEWSKKFDPKLTVTSNFNNNKGESVPINYMTTTDSVAYYSDHYGQYVEIPYGNKSFSMAIFLPSANTDTMLNHLNATAINGIFSKMRSQQVKLIIPRLKIEATYDLKKVLISMGMTDAFNEKANFSGISTAPLSISQVLQKTYLTIDEDGTEAAAVTLIGFETTSINQTVFAATHPFIYFIREKSTGVILFAGIIGNPKKY